MCKTSCLELFTWRAIRNCLFPAVVLLAVAPVAGAADSADTAPTPTISGFIDLDGDHRISIDEFIHNAVTKAMREKDADKDGSLSASEAAAAENEENSGATELNFSAVDANGDGRVSLDELKQALHANPDVNQLFQKLDKDQDGFLSESELQENDAAPLFRFKF